MRAARWLPAAGPLVFFLAIWLLDDRLPDPLASHWPIGAEPDGSIAPVWLCLMLGAIWWLIWVVVLVAGRGRLNLVTRSRPLTPSEQWIWSYVTFGLLAGVFGIVIWANLDVETWHDSRIGASSIVAVVISTAVGGLLGWRLSRMARA